MNGKQKICLVVAITSIIVFLISAHMFTNIPSRLIPGSTYDENTIWVVTYTSFKDVRLKFNWGGAFSLATFFGSLSGFFLFSETNYLKRFVSFPKRLFSWISDKENFGIVIPLFMLLFVLIIVLLAAYFGDLRLY